MRGLLLSGALAAALAAAAAPPALAAEGVLTSRGDLVAKVEGSRWCANKVDLAIDAPSKAAFGGDRAELKAFIAQIVEVLDAQCPQAKSLKVEARVKGDVATRYYLAAKDGWALPSK